MQQNIIVMGVSGSGKSSVAAALADRLDATFYDGDDYHPATNIQKMAAGIPLCDQDRKPWLEQLARVIQKTQGASVTACSALKASYRDCLRSSGSPTFVFLDGSRELLLKRMIVRSDHNEHFMPTSLLDSQLQTLEDPSNENDCIRIPINQSISEIVDHVLTNLR